MLNPTQSICEPNFTDWIDSEYVWPPEPLVVAIKAGSISHCLLTENDSMALQGFVTVLFFFGSILSWPIVLPACLHL